MSVTIKDVAALAGVSPSTVSRTCKNHPSISKETKEKVRKAMAELGYEPNFQASNLANQNSRTIGIILPPSEQETYENSFYLECIRGISLFCNHRQYVNTIITGRDTEEILKAVSTMIRSGRVDGFIVLYSREQDPVVNYLFSEGILYVLIGKAYQLANETIYIDNDNQSAGHDAAEYLYQLGHRKIAYIGSDNAMIFSADRKRGYQTALLKHNLPIIPEYCIETGSLYQDAPGRMTELLTLADRPTAVVSSDDIIAHHLERICLELGLRIPEDISVISFNNSLLARICTPQLTSIDINSEQLGIEAASQMINHIENSNLMATKIIVPHYLIERESCRKITG